MPHTEGNTASLWIYCKLLPTFWVKRRRYLVESESPLKGSISDGHRDVVHCSLFQQVMHLVRCNIELRGKRWASTLSEENPARLTPSTWRIWSPNLRPPSAAGEPLVTRQTKTPAQGNLQLKSCSNLWWEPLLTAFTLSPILPSASLQRTTCLTPWVTWEMIFTSVVLKNHILGNVWYGYLPPSTLLYPVSLLFGCWDRVQADQHRNTNIKNKDHLVAN